MPDNRFRNRPPAYPAEAEKRGQHGAVLFIIHVSENGVATGAEVAASFGHIHPRSSCNRCRPQVAVSPGNAGWPPIPFDMPFRFIFTPIKELAPWCESIRW